jgi:hypothetical protein
MRRLVIATTLAAALAPAAALDAAAAPGIVVKPRTIAHALGCKVTSAGFIDVHNTTKRTIPVGTEIALVIVVKRISNRGIRHTATTKQALSPNLVHAFPMPKGASSCRASVQLLPDYMRR